MSRSIRAAGSALLAAVALFGAAGDALAQTTFDTGMVTVMAATKAVRVDVGGIVVVSVDKVSNPGVQVRVTLDEGSAPVVMTTHAAGENNCGAVDNPAAGTLNRTVMVQGGPTANVYVKVQYTTTTVLGIATTTVLEPLGPMGMTVAVPGLTVGLPINICVA